MNKFLKSPFGIILSTFVLTVVLFLGAREAGFHKGNGFSIVRGGSITINKIDSNTKVFIDNKERTNKIENSELKIKNIAPGMHIILVSKDGYIPWSKTIEVFEKKETIISPFMLSRNVNGVIVTEADSEYYKIRSEVRSSAIPTVSNKRISTSGNIATWIEGENIIVEWLGDIDLIPQYFCIDGECTSTIEVISSKVTLRNLDFYSDRDDVLLLSSDIGVYALEIDKRGIQNFQPLYKGTSFPIFSVNDAHSLYILDGTILFIVNI